MPSFQRQGYSRSGLPGTYPSRKRRGPRKASRSQIQFLQHAPRHTNPENFACPAASFRIWAHDQIRTGYPISLKSVKS